MISTINNNVYAAASTLQRLRGVLTSVQNRAIAAASCCFPVRYRESAEIVSRPTGLILPSPSTIIDILTVSPELSPNNGTIQLRASEETSSETLASEITVASCRPVIEMHVAAKYAESRYRMNSLEYEVITQLQILQENQDSDFVHSWLDSLAKEIYQKAFFNEEEAAEFCEDLEGYSDHGDYFIAKFSAFSFPEKKDVNLDIQANYLKLRNPSQKWIDETIANLRTERDEFVALSANIERCAKAVFGI